MFIYRSEKGRGEGPLPLLIAVTALRTRPEEWKYSSME
jgi:hypothetical protein